MKPWVIGGVFVGLALLTLLAREPKGRPEVSTRNPGWNYAFERKLGTSFGICNDGAPWTTASVTLDPSDTPTLAEEDSVRLLLEDEDGGRAVVMTYFMEDGRLVMTDIHGARPVIYPLLIVLKQDGTVVYLPAEVDLQAAKCVVS